MYLWGLFVCFTVVVALCFLIWLPVRVVVGLRRQQGDDEGSLEIRYLFGLIKWRKKLFSIATKNSDEGLAVAVKHQSMGTQTTPSKAEHDPSGYSEITLEEVWKTLLNWRYWKSIFELAWPIIKNLGRRTWVRKLKVELTVGTSDVISTGLACGVAWAITMAMVSPLTYLARFSQDPSVQIDADYQHAKFEGSAECIVEVRLGYAILAGLRLVRLWKNSRLEQEER